jgi:hypothetical protein
MNDNLYEVLGKLTGREDGTFMVYAGAAKQHAMKAHQEAIALGDRERADCLTRAIFLIDDAMYPDAPVEDS